MRKTTVSTTLGYILICYILLLFIPFLNQFAIAQNKPQGVNEVSKTTFELKNGDRVVFLGNSLFENDLQYGYVELALTTRWPDRDVTFRNIGWAGDNVFGDARSYFTNPPTSYDLLIEQIKKAQPTIVFIGYGGIEAQEGEAGLARFNEGLKSLLDTIDHLGAKAILLSPIPIMSAGSLENGSLENIGIRNKNLELYASAIAKTASERGKQFIDIFNPLAEMNKKVALTDDGVHLNETGYYYLATTLENGLGLALPRKEAITIRVSKHGIEASAPAKMLDGVKDIGNFQFKISEEYLPLPLPEQNAGIVDNLRLLQIRGLKKGFYTLSVDNAQVITASAKKWEEGVEIKQGPSFIQASQLRQMIVKKNELFFHQYRPLNRTYIIGFRSYEQGRHKQGLEDLNFIITWLEGQIALNRTPKPKVYQLTLAK